MGGRERQSVVVRSTVFNTGGSTTCLIVLYGVEIQRERAGRGSVWSGGKRLRGGDRGCGGVVAQLSTCWQRRPGISHDATERRFGQQNIAK